jgi:hypothetical protein
VYTNTLPTILVHILPLHCSTRNLTQR